MNKNIEPEERNATEGNVVEPSHFQCEIQASSNLAGSTRTGLLVKWYNL